MEIKKRIHNWYFVLSLSMVTDVYKVYRKISCILQRINILPHEKYDSFVSYLSTYKEMMDTCDYLDCPCTMFTNPDTFQLEEQEEWKGVVFEVCKWPRLHQAAAVALGKGTYMDVNIGMVKPTEWRTRAGQPANKQWLDMNVMVKFLYEGLKEKVYEKEEVTYIENCRRILYLRSHVKKNKEHGAVKISGLQLRTFREVALYFEPDIDTRVDADELRVQWRLYNSVLEGLVVNKSMGLDSMSSIDILRNLIDPKKELYRYLDQSKVIITIQFLLVALRIF